MIRLKFTDFYKHRKSKNTNKKNFWFPFDTDFFEQTEMYAFGPDELLTVIYLRCEAGKANKDGELNVIFEHYQRHVRLHNHDAHHVLNHTIKKLKQLQIITTPRSAGKFTKVATDIEIDKDIELDKEIELEKNNTIMADCPSGQSRRVYDFDSLYNKYPKKEGKSRGMFLCRTQIKTPKDFNDLSTAIDRYNKNLQEKRTEPKYIKQFSTFMASWKDWLEPDAGKVITPAKEEPEWIRKAREEDEKNAV